MPANRGSLHCCEAFFSLLCFGVFHTTIHIRRNSSVVRSTMLFPPPAGCPCRAPAAVSPPRHKARPYWGSPCGRHSGVPPGVFFGYRGVLRSWGQGVSPWCSSPRFSPLPPCPNARHLHTLFVCPVGAGLCPGRARGLRPCAPRGGRVRRPPAPPATPTRGAVFFIVVQLPHWVRAGREVRFSPHFCSTNVKVVN